MATDDHGVGEQEKCLIAYVFGRSGTTVDVGGVRGLTKTAALELGRDNIRVNSIHPGPVRTPMTAGPDAAAAVAAAARGLAIPRVAEPDEITRLVLFVASDEASFSTGSEFIVDGGMLLGPAPASSPKPQRHLVRAAE